jgi:hypothetical protein
MKVFILTKNKKKKIDLKIEVFKEGWTVISEDKAVISLGKYPNARWSLIENALEYVRKK